MVAKNGAGTAADGCLIPARLRPPPHLGRIVVLSDEPGDEPHGGDRRFAVVAPPGFGKTRFLATWHDRLIHQAFRVGWFSCDGHDDASLAIAYIGAALGVDAHVTANLEPDDTVRRLQAIIASVDRREAVHHLFIDDMSNSADAVRAEVLYPLLRLAPANMRIVVALDHVPRALERHIDRVIDQRALRFGLEDVRALCGRGVTDHRARAILRQSQGWPILADILVDHYRRASTQSDPDMRLSRFVRTRIAPLLSTEDLIALRHLASLRVFDATMARLIAAEDVIDRLVALAAIAPVFSRDGRDYAVNPVLAAILIDDKQGEAAAVKARAAADLLARGHFVAATRLAVEIGDDALLTAIVDACDPLSTFLGQGIAPLERIAALIPPHMAARNLQISCAAAVALLKTGHLRQARVIFSDLERRFAAMLQGEAVAPRLRIQVLIAKSLLNIHQGREIPRADFDALEKLAGPMTGEIALLETVTTMLRTHMHQIFGELPAARRSAERGVHAAIGGGGRYAAFFHLFDIALIEGVEGRSDAACAELARISSVYRDILRSDPRIAVIRDAFRIELDHECDPADLGAAGRLRTICRKLPSMEGWPDVFYAAYRTYSEKLFLAGDLAGARALLDAGVAYAEREDVTPLLFVLAHQRALIALMAAEPVAAEAAIMPYRDLTAADIARRPWREIEVCVEVRAALVAYRPDPSLPELLAMATGHARRYGNVRLLNRCTAVSRPGSRGLRLAIGAEPGPDSAAAPPDAAGLAHLLTPRSRQIIAKLAEGLTDKEIGLALGISPHGVRYHLKRAYAQMEVGSRAQALHKARDIGLLV